jgi:DNA (cytosine-5)-methyltransferase 1
MFYHSAPKYLSLFSGCGGLDLGFSEAGFEGVLSVDIDEAALLVHSTNFKHPVKKLDLTKELPHLDPEIEIDVLLAGSPCQGFSTAGLRKVDDPRNSLLFVAAQVAAKLKPKIVVAENVPGALSGEHKKYWTTLHEQLRAQGYSTRDLHVNSADFGVAQRRQRIFLIASRTGELSDFHMQKLPAISLGDVLGDLAGLSNHQPILLDKKTDDYKIAVRIGQGQKLTNARGGDRVVHTWDIPEVFGPTTVLERSVLNHVLKLRRQARRRDFGDADPVCTKFLIGIYGENILHTLVRKKYLRQVGDYHDLTGTFNGKFRRLDLGSPSRTVDTRFGDFRLFLHPLENRGFTVREAARIQGFPDSFCFSGSLAQQFRMIGNAVPPPLAYSVANLVTSLLNK